MSDAIVVLCTCSDTAQADHIATALLDERLAACINLVPNVTSYFRWQDKVEHASEVQLIIKTRRSLFAALCERVQALHSYDVPELIAVPIERGSTDYLTWLHEQTE